MKYTFPGLALFLLTAVLTGLVAFYLGALNEDIPQASLPPSHALQPPALPSGSPITPRVFLIIADGLGSSDIHAHPDLQTFAKHGLSLNARSVYPSFTYPAHLSILSGTTPERHGIRTDATSLPPSVSTLLSTKLPSTLFTTSATFQKRFSTPSVTSSVIPPTTSTQEATPHVDTILSSSTPLTVVHIDTLDRIRAQHHTPYTTTPPDPKTPPLLSALLQRIDLSKHTVILTSSHGYTHHGGHGGREDTVRSVPLMLAGQGVNRSATPMTPSIASIAPTIAYILQHTPPADASSTPFLPLFHLPQRDAHAAHWTQHRTAYERAWLQHVFNTWTKVSWDGERIGNDVSHAASSAPANADLKTLLQTRRATYDQIQRDRRVGRTPAIALLAAILIILTAAGLLYSYRATPLLTLPVLPLSAAALWMGLGLPFSLSASPSLPAFLTLITTTSLLASLLTLIALEFTLRPLQSELRTEARRFHLALFAVFYTFLTFALWLLQGYQPPPPLPSSAWLFAPLWLGSITAPFALFASLHWIASVRRQLRSSPEKTTPS